MGRQSHSEFVCPSINASLIVCGENEPCFILKVCTGTPRPRAAKLDSDASTLGTETRWAENHCPSCSGRQSATVWGQDWEQLGRVRLPRTLPPGKGKTGFKGQTGVKDIIRLFWKRSRDKRTARAVSCHAARSRCSARGSLSSASGCSVTLCNFLRVNRTVTYRLDGRSNPLG